MYLLLIALNIFYQLWLSSVHYRSGQILVLVSPEFFKGLEWKLFWLNRETDYYILYQKKSVLFFFFMRMFTFFTQYNYELLWCKLKCQSPKYEMSNNLEITEELKYFTSLKTYF